jgi:DNA-binding IclR family transcriptional regulator
MAGKPADVQGIKSIEVGGRILNAIAEAGGPVSLTEIAAAAGLPNSNTRRYLISFARIGLVTQKDNNGRYGLGPLALRLGLAALGELDVVDVGGEVIADLSNALNLTVALIVWGDTGPTVVRFNQSRHNVAIHVRVGAVVPLLTSAAGRVFLSFLPQESTASHVARELSASDPRPAGTADWFDDRKRQRRIAEIVKNRFASVDGAVVPGLRAVAAPAFDSNNEICAAIVVYGPAAAIELSAGDVVLAPLMRAAETLSTRLGHGALQKS